MAKMVDKLFIDTNILLYANLVSSPFNSVARQRLQAYHESNTELWINRQVIREYLTNISKLNPSLPKVVTADHLLDFQSLIQDFMIADESESTSNHLFNLLNQVPCGGKQVHDANIVATMLQQDIKYILTYNVADFVRFNDLIQIVPLI
jgi:predicted nucleic acid-binding protein